MQIITQKKQSSTGQVCKQKKREWQSGRCTSFGGGGGSGPRRWQLIQPVNRTTAEFKNTRAHQRKEGDMEKEEKQEGFKPNLPVWMSESAGFGLSEFLSSGCHGNSWIWWRKRSMSLLKLSHYPTSVTAQTECFAHIQGQIYMNRNVPQLLTLTWFQNNKWIRL